MNITTKLETISPKEAEKYASNISSEHQRPFSDSYCESIAREMLGGHWKISHQGICFDEDGRLTDGQHRIKAVIRSGVTIQANVTRGMPVYQGNVKTFDVFDSQKIRGVNCKLSMNGYSYSSRTASSCLTIQIAACGARVKASYGATMGVLKIYGKDVLPYVTKATEVTGLRMGPLSGALSMCRHVFQDEVDVFFDELMTGENIKRGMPSYALRSYMLTQKYKGDGGDKARNNILRSAMTACMKHVLKEEVEVLKSSSQGIEFFLSKQKGDINKVRDICGYK